MSIPLLFLASMLGSDPEPLPTPESLFSFRQATIEKIKNIEFTFDCKQVASGRTSTFGPYLYRRQGEEFRLLSNAPGIRVDCLVSPFECATINFTKAMEPAFGVRETSDDPHICRDPWRFMRFSVRNGQKERVTFGESLASKSLNEVGSTSLFDQYIYQVTIEEKTHRTTVDFDKRLGYQIVRSETVFSTPKDTTQKYSFSGFQFYNGIPIPQTIVEEIRHSGTDTIRRMTLSKIECNTPRFASKMRFGFPTGLTIHDKISKTTYEMGVDGRKLNERELEMGSSLPPSKEGSVKATITGNEESPAYSSFSWLVPLSLVALIAIYFVKRRIQRQSQE